MRDEEQSGRRERAQYQEKVGVKYEMRFESRGFSALHRFIDQRQWSPMDSSNSATFISVFSSSKTQQVRRLQYRLIKGYIYLLEP